MHKLFSFIWFLSLVAVADGVDHGNGGDLVKCGQDGKVLSQLLDYYEAQKLAPELKIALGEKKMTPLEHVGVALERLARLDLERANFYKERAIDFIKEINTRWVRGVRFRDIPDSGYVPLENCSLHQIAIQKTPINPGDRRYTIDQDLWDELDNENKAGLILHEVIYREMISLGHRNSISTRKFNALLSSNAFSKMTQEQYEVVKKKFFSPPKLLAFRDDRVEILLTNSSPLTENLNSYLCAVGRRKLAWNILEKPSKWLQLEKETGVLSGTPPKGTDFSLSYNLSVTDGFDWAVVPLTIRVTSDLNPPPVWVFPSIELYPVQIGKEFRFKIQDLAIDAGQRPLGFSLSLGPSWLEVSSEGELRGTPLQEDLGENAWAILARAGHAQAVAELKFKVVK